jgi:hypothetical protein
MVKNREEDNGMGYRDSSKSPHIHAGAEGYRITRSDWKDQPGRE